MAKRSYFLSGIHVSTRPLVMRYIIRGQGTNYINISHESKTERSSEAVIWQWMLLIGWYCWSKTIFFSLADAKFNYLQLGVLFTTRCIFIVFFLDQKVKIVISYLNQDGVFPKYGSHYTTCNSWKKSGWRYVFPFFFPLFMFWLELTAYRDAPHVLWDAE